MEQGLNDMELSAHDATDAHPAQQGKSEAADTDGDSHSLQIEDMSESSKDTSSSSSNEYEALPKPKVSRFSAIRGPVVKKRRKKAAVWMKVDERPFAAYPEGYCDDDWSAASVGYGSH